MDIQKKHSKDLLRLEKPYFMDDDENNPVEDKYSVIRKFIRKSKRSRKPMISEFPKSSLLQTLKDFLPQIKAANENITEKIHKINDEQFAENFHLIEKKKSESEEEDEQLIEMNVFIPTIENKTKNILIEEIKNTQ